MEGQTELEVRLVAMRSRGCALGAAGCAGAALWSLEQPQKNRTRLFADKATFEVNSGLRTL